MPWNYITGDPTYMLEDTKTITRCTHYVFAAGYIERCGDHACKIAEKLQYKVDGINIEMNQYNIVLILYSNDWVEFAESLIFVIKRPIRS